MNFIGKHIQLIGILLLTVFVGAAAGLYFDVPARLQKTRPAGSAKQTFTCPMHADVVQDHPGDCPKGGMALVPASQAQTGHEQCGNNGENHPGCCADKKVGQASSLTVHGASSPRGSSGRMPPEPADKMSAPHSRNLRLPPGHPPIPGWTTDAPESKPASTTSSTHSSH